MALRRELRERDDWFQKFQEGLGRHDKQIEELIETSQKLSLSILGEQENRLESLMDIHKEVGGIRMEAYKTAAVAGVIAGPIIALLLLLVTAVLGM